MKPSPIQITQVINEVVSKVEDVKALYDEANTVVRLRIRENISNCYQDSCKGCKEVLSAEDFIDDMDNTIGWDWIGDSI